ncbi:MAG: Ig-like domain-containing protein [Blautia sp.]
MRFSSSDSSIAAVDQKGKITPKKNGKVTVKAYLVDGSGKNVWEQRIAVL